MTDVRTVAMATENELGLNARCFSAWQVRPVSSVTSEGSFPATSRGGVWPRLSALLLWIFGKQHRLGIGQILNPNDPNGWFQEPSLPGQLVPCVSLFILFFLQVHTQFSPASSPLSIPRHFHPHKMLPNLAGANAEKKCTLPRPVCKVSEMESSPANLKRNDSK
jgi:hypothetical protein